MPEPNVDVTLTAADGRESVVPGILTEVAAGTRFRRVAVTLGVALVLTAAMIPIPIVHFIGVPLVLIGGIAAAVWQGKQVATLERVEIPCPCCGAANRVGGGPGYPSTTGPFSHPCTNCRLPLTLRLAPISARDIPA